MLLQLSLAGLFTLFLIVSLFVRRSSSSRFAHWRVSAQSLAGACFFYLGISNSNYSIVLLGLVFLLISIAGIGRLANCGQSKRLGLSRPRSGAVAGHVKSFASTGVGGTHLHEQFV